MTQPSRPQPSPLLPVIYGAYQLRQEQDVALRPVLTRTRQLFLMHGVPITVGQRSSMAAYLWRPMKNARTRTYQASARYLRGHGVADVPPMREYRIDALEQLLENVIDRTVVAGDPIAETNRTSPVVVEQARKSVARGVSRHAQQPARETVQETANESGREVGWARMLTGPRSCAFCAMLASRGPIFRSDKSALYKGGESADTYHDGCDCIAVLVREGIPWEGQGSHQRLATLWDDTGGQASGKQARNAFRREWDKTVRNGGSGDFLADSLKPPGGA